MEQRLFVLREVTWPQQPVDGSLHPASYLNRQLLGEWVLAFQAEAVPFEATDLETALIVTDRLLMEEHLYIWLANPDGHGPQPVAMAARARPTERGVAVNLVYTPPEFRRKGFASAVVAHLSHRLLEDGWQFCTLFTDLSNPTSNHIYQSIGYTPVMDFTEYRLISGN
jgi:GNAT superfamily N-acetyltransferase